MATNAVGHQAEKRQSTRHADKRRQAEKRQCFSRRTRNEPSCIGDMVISCRQRPRVHRKGLKKKSVEEGGGGGRSKEGEEEGGDVTLIMMNDARAEAMSGWVSGVGLGVGWFGGSTRQK